MGNRKFSGFVSVVLAQFVAMTMLVIGARAASTTISGGADGEYLDTDLVMDNAGVWHDGAGRLRLWHSFSARAFS